MTTVIKSRGDAPAGFFEAEAAGLAWLSAAGGARTVGVIRVEPELIELERIDEVAPTAPVARRFGADLARTHAAGASAFGVGPTAELPQFIGSRPMASAASETWGEFYARDRVLPFLAAAERAGNISSEGARRVEKACARVAAGEFDDGEPASRIHGDLWSGNVLWGRDGVVLIDPAAHGGHRETDLAMLDLFGCPFLDEIRLGYEEVSPLPSGWRERIPLHQLHPLAVHAAGHGAAYGYALTDAADAVLALPPTA